jgi:thermitase
MTRMKMIRKKIVFTIFTIFAFVFSIYADADASPASARQEFVPNQIILKVSETAGTTGPQFIERGGTPLFKNRGNLLRNTLTRRFSQIKSIRHHHSTGYLIVETSDGCDIEGLSKELKNTPGVVDASPNYYAVIADSTLEVPNDPYFQYQYALQNTGQVYYPQDNKSGTAGCDMNALTGWEWTTGSNDIIIAVIDSGVANDHVDLSGKVIAGYNFIDDNTNAYDDHGHGTLVASIAAAHANNGEGIAGVCWNAKIMPIKTMAADGYGSYLAIGEGIRFAASHGAHVINLSVGGRNSSFILEDACAEAFNKGAVLFAVAGNYSVTVHYPAAYDQYVMAVAATDANDDHASFSAIGPEVDIAAPGYFIWGAHFDPNNPGNLNDYHWGSGTSYATPYAAGAAALLLSYKPFLTNEQVMTLIRYTADDVNFDTHPGIDNYLGYGRINLGTLLAPYELD